MNPTESPAKTSAPWWREPMLWLVIGGPLVVVVAAIVTAAIAWHGADIVLTEPVTRALQADASLEPALRARNHAATPR
jgi:hypothetical protein